MISRRIWRGSRGRWSSLLRAGDGGDLVQTLEKRLEREGFLEDGNGTEPGEPVEDIFFAEAAHDEDAGARIEGADLAEDFGAVESIPVTSYDPDASWTPTAD